MPRKPRFISGVKRLVSESIKLNPGKPRLVGGELHKMIFNLNAVRLSVTKNLRLILKDNLLPSIMKQIHRQPVESARRLLPYL